MRRRVLEFKVYGNTIDTMSQVEADFGTRGKWLPLLANAIRRGFNFSTRAAENFTGAVIAMTLLSTAAHGSVDLDKKYQLETIGILRSTDNVDDLFAEYVATAYKDY